MAQIDAGADAVQIFDSRAGVLGERNTRRNMVKPVARIIASVRCTGRIEAVFRVVLPTSLGRLSISTSGISALALTGLPPVGSILATRRGFWDIPELLAG